MLWFDDFALHGMLWWLFAACGGPVDETKAQMGNLRLTATALMLHCTTSEDTPAAHDTTSSLKCRPNLRMSIQCLISVVDCVAVK